jgi:glycosyltransferase involved in cell wall biosynthesis
VKIVFDNIIFFLQNSGGGSVYWAEIIKRAISDPQIDAQFSEPSIQTDNFFRRSLEIKPKYIEKLPIHFLRISNFSRRLNEKFIFHSSYYRISDSEHAINIVTIHDFTSELFLKGLRRYVHRTRKKKAIENADGIICISNNTKKDLTRFYPEISEGKIKVIYNGVSDDYYRLKEGEVSDDYAYKDILKEKYILFVGHRTSYKNFRVAVETVELISSEFKLVIIGENLTGVETELLNKKIPERFYCLSGVDNKTLNVFYNNAYCLLYPSSYEGFGIPVIEAMKAGCPVITTNKSSIPEVAGNAAHMVENINPDSFSVAIQNLGNDKSRNQMIANGIINAERFSWDKTYKELKDFYTEVYNRKQ